MSLHYECHVTVKDAPTLQDAVERLGWKYSRIDGDPVLGEGVNAYATRHFPPQRPVTEVLAEVTSCAAALRVTGYEVVRSKVELVLHDTRSH